MDAVRFAVWRDAVGASAGKRRLCCENNNNYIYRDRGRAPDRRSATWRAGYSLVALAAFLCYANNLRADFVHDDVRAITGNPDVRRETAVLELFRNDFWGKPVADRTSHKSYRPITVLTFRLNHLLGDFNPAHYHLTNNMLHSLATVVYTHVCRRAVFAGEPFPSILAGLLFAVHPVHSEAVSGLVGRADILSCLFFLLSFLGYFRHSAALQEGDEHAARGRVSLMWTIICATLALLSKEQGITVLALCIFNEVYSAWQQWSTAGVTVYSTRAFNSRRKTILQISISLVVLCLYRVWMLGGTYPSFQEEDNPASFSSSSTVRVLTYVYLWAFNGWLMLCPVHLSHDWQMGSIPLVQSARDIRNTASLLLVVLLISLTWKAFTCNKARHRSRVWFGLLLTVLPFLLASNVFITVGFVVAERVLYMPSMGVIVLVVSGLDMLRISLPLYWRYIKPFSVVVLVLLPACRTIIRNRVWQNRQVLARSGIQILPHNAKMHYNYGNILADVGDIDGAVNHYRTAISLWPSYTSAHNNLGFYLSNKTEAMIHLNEAIRLSPCHANAHSNMAGVYHSSLNRTEEALSLLHFAMECESGNPTPHLSLAAIYEDLGDFERAEAHYTRAVQLAPSRDSVHHHAGLFYAARGQYEVAVKHFEKAGSLSLKSLAKLYGNMGEIEKAEQCWTKVLDTSRDPGSLDLAGTFYFNIGRLEKSIRLYEEAYARDPDNMAVVLHLTQALINNEQNSDAERLLLKHLKRDPEDVELTIHLANVYGLNKLHNEAIDLIENFLKRRSTELSAKQLSTLYHQIGNHMKDLLEFDLAIENYDRAIQLDDTNADCHHNLAVYYHRKHIFERARYHYESAYRLSPEDDLLKANYNRFQQDLGQLSSAIDADAGEGQEPNNDVQPPSPSPSV